MYVGTQYFRYTYNHHRKDNDILKFTSNFIKKFLYIIFILTN